MLKQRAMVVRDVMVRGTIKKEGAFLEIVDRPTSTYEITQQEFADLKSSNHVREIVEKTHEPLSSQQAAAVQAAMAMDNETQAKK